MAYTTIDDPSAYFQTALYSSTGGGGSITVTNDGNSDLQPDWIWIKVRNGANNHNTFDSSRSNFGERLFPNLTSQSDSVASVSVSSDGFATGTGYGDINNTSGANNYVAWQWKANGGTTASNTNGTINSTVQANTTAGFSIVTYTGNGSGGATIGHGLGVVPKWFFVKSRSVINRSWIHYHNGTGSTPENDYLNFTLSAKGTTSAAWNNTAPTTSVASLGSSAEVNENGTTFVGYFFAEVQGYSKFGSWTGNANDDGPFIYTGFKPAFLLFKNANASERWFLSDNKRDTFNSVEKHLRPDVNDAEYSTTSSIDYLSNGFKIREDDAHMNGSGNTIIYMAFAEHPFVSSEGVPTTAR